MGVAVVVPMKRELKNAGPAPHSPPPSSVAVVVPMKRELKIIINPTQMAEDMKVAVVVPMKRELKTCPFTYTGLPPCSSSRCPDEEGTEKRAGA